MPFGLANTLYPAAGKTPFLTEMKHGVSEKPIRLGLVAGTIGFEPGDDIRIQAHGDGLLPGSIKLADFGAAPIENRGSIGKINFFVSLGGDGADVPLLLLGELSHRCSFRATRRRERR